MKDKLISKYVSPYFYQFKLFSPVQQHSLALLNSHLDNDIKDQWNKSTKKKSPSVKCDNCQGYRHKANTCISLFRVAIIGEVPTTVPKLDSIIPPVITHVVKEFSNIAPKDSDEDEEITGNYIEESSTSISLEVTQVTTEFTDVSPNDSTPILFEVTLLITELVDVLSEDLPDKVPPMRVEYVIMLVSGASLPDLLL